MMSQRSTASAIQFALLRLIDSNGVDVHSRLEPASIEHGFFRGGAGGHNLRAPNGFFRRRNRRHWNAQPRRHFLGESLSPPRIAAEGANALQFSHGSDRFQLRACLQARADDRGDSGILSRHQACRHSAGRARAHLAEIIRFDQRHQIARIRTETASPENARRRGKSNRSSAPCSRSSRSAAAMWFSTPLPGHYAAAGGIGASPCLPRAAGKKSSTASSAIGIVRMDLRPLR